jgi:hypothetical protein
MWIPFRKKKKPYAIPVQLGKPCRVTMIEGGHEHHVGLFTIIAIDRHWDREKGTLKLTMQDSVSHHLQTRYNGEEVPE